MAGPPSDIAMTLPENWKEQALAFSPSGTDRPIILVLQEYLKHHQDKSIAIPAIQTLSEWVTEKDRDCNKGPFPKFRSLIEDMNKHTGSWAIDTVIDELKKEINAHPIDFASKLASCLAEWQVLQYLVQRNWTAIESQRGNCDYDWLVKKDVELHIEVKLKASMGSASHALESWIYGLALLPNTAWMHRYRWHCQISEKTGSKKIKPFGEALQTHQEEISHALEHQMTQTNDGGNPSPIGQTGISICTEIQCNQPEIELCLESDSNIRVGIKRNTCPGILSVTGDNNCWWINPYLEKPETEQTLKVLGRLKASKQNATRHIKGLYVFVWYVPNAWEIKINRPWLDETCNELAKELKIQSIAIWPQGNFEVKCHPWVLNKSAENEFPELGNNLC